MLQFLDLTARGLTSQMCISRKPNNNHIFTRFFLKVILPKCSRAVCARTIFMEILPLREYFPRSSSPCRIEIIRGTQDCLPARVKFAAPIPPAVTGDISADRKNESPFSKWVRPSQLLIRGGHVNLIGFADSRFYRLAELMSQPGTIRDLPRHPSPTFL